MQQRSNAFGLGRFLEQGISILPFPDLYVGETELDARLSALIERKRTMLRGEEQKAAWTDNSWYHAMARQNVSKEFFAHDL